MVKVAARRCRLRLRRSSACRACTIRKWPKAQAPQLMAALRTANAQPSKLGSSQPFGSDGRSARRAAPTTLGYFGGQAVPMPGTTLNSIGGGNDLIGDNSYLADMMNAQGV